MRKKGFTIAEVLVTMAVVGIIVALTIPTFVDNTKKRTWANSLSTSVTNLETSLKALLMRENVYSLYDTTMMKNVGNTLNNSSSTSTLNKFSAGLGEVLAISKSYQKCENCYTKKIKSISNTEISYFNAAGFEGKNAAVYWFNINKTTNLQNAKEQEDIHTYGGNLYELFAELYIDVNGAKKPNTVGRDIFRFYVGTDGTVYPYGGPDASIYLTNSTNKTWDSSSAGEYKCLDNNIGSPGYGCTARLIENRYKMDY